MLSPTQMIQKFLGYDATSYVKTELIVQRQQFDIEHRDIMVHKNKVQSQFELMLNRASQHVQKRYIRKDASLIEHIVNPSEKVQMFAIELDAMNIEYVNDPLESVQLEAIMQNPKCFRLISRPTKQAQLIYNLVV